MISKNDSIADLTGFGYTDQARMIARLPMDGPMPLPDLNDLKAFAKIDHDHEDLLLSSLLSAAIEYAEAATGRDFTTDTPDRARIAIMALAGFWFDFRLPVGGETRPPPFHVRSLLHQLRDWQDPATVQAP